MELITISRLRSYRRCPRREHFSYALRYKPVATDEVLRFGTWFHAGKEAWRLARMEGGDALDRALTAIRSLWCQDEHADEFDLARVVETMIGYHARWSDEPYKVLAVEAEFRTDLRNPDTGRISRTWRQGGKMDAIVQDLRDGRIYAEETKTTSLDISPGSEYWERLRIDGQISLYIDGAAALGYEVAGCLYDVARRPMQRPFEATPEDARKYTKGRKCKVCFGCGALGTPEHTCRVCEGSGWEEAPRLYASQRAEDETPSEFSSRVRESIARDPESCYARGTVVRMGDELEAARRNVWLYAKLIRETRAQADGMFNPGACQSFGSTCPYWTVCTGQASLDDPHLFTRSEYAHSELSDNQPKEEAPHVQARKPETINPS